MKSLKILISLLVVFVLLILSFNFLLNSDNFFQEQLSKHGSYARVGNAEEINKAVVDYLMLETNELQVGGFNEREVSHLADVKRIVWQLNNLMIAMFFLLTALLAFLVKRVGGFRTLCWEISKTSLIILFVMAVFSILSFSFLFTGFHQVFFDSGTWLFNKDDLLIKLYPIGFFKEFFQNILILTVLYNLLLLVFSKTK